MGFFSEQPGFHSLSSDVSQMITSFTGKETLPKLKLSLISDNGASGGPAVSSFI